MLGSENSDTELVTEGTVHSDQSSVSLSDPSTDMASDSEYSETDSEVSRPVDQVSLEPMVSSSE